MLRSGGVLQRYRGMLEGHGPRKHVAEAEQVIADRDDTKVCAL